MNKKKGELYIAYGSNLNVEQMAFRCPDAMKMGTTIIENYKLNFRGTSRGSGVANIERCKGSTVPVGIWYISKSDEENLDMYEGFPRLYQKYRLIFPYGSKKYSGIVYIMRPGHMIMEPSYWYENTIREGYKDFGIDPKLLDRAIANCRTEKKTDEDWRIYYSMNNNWAGYRI